MTSNFTETTLVGIKGRFAASGASGAGGASGAQNREKP